MNKTSKLFGAAIFLLSVACKDAPMTEPITVTGVEYLNNNKNRKVTVNFRNLLKPIEVSIDFDSCSYFLNGKLKNQRVRDSFDGIKFVFAAISEDNKLFLRTEGTDIEMFSSPQIFFNIKASQGYINRNEESGKLGYCIMKDGKKAKIFSEYCETILELVEPHSGKSWVIGFSNNQAVRIVMLN